MSLQAMTRVLLVHGGALEWERLAGGLAREGLRTLTSRTAEEALRTVRRSCPDAVVIDSEDAALDAPALCRAIRAHSGPAGPSIVLLGHRRDDPHVAAAYEAGADAYAPLPCAPQVLAARLLALTRTAAASAAKVAALERPLEPVLRVGGWELDRESLEARSPARGGAPVALTPTEFRLLHLLAANAGRTVPTDRLGEYAEVARVRAHVSRLRRKLGLPAAGPGAIVATEGLGYAYVPSRAAAA